MIINKDCRRSCIFVGISLLISIQAITSKEEGDCGYFDRSIPTGYTSIEDDEYDDSLSPRNHSNRISNGRDAARGQFPSYVSIVSTLDRGYFALCGGTIIDRRHILTAAHCIDKRNLRRIQVYTGYLSRNDYGERINGKGCIARNYRSMQPDFDMAIITLERDITYSTSIQPACLPERPITENDRAIIAGMGFVSLAPRREASRLQYVTTRKIPCTRIFGNNKYSMCSSTKIGETCQGDSGGPVYAVVNNAHVVYGIVSRGELGCSRGHEILHTDVWKVLRAIKDLMYTCR